ncbi:MAG TPA: FAD-dependent oxidoreductase, partial [Candidatus Limnocylindrales bacterium]|nr:FAD-dependent oxidoreductase [Candidatus Limnocylindrales bacterium]
GFTGLWSAIRLLETAPDLRVVVLEAEVVGWGASGRNGGFCASSLTHGMHNAELHFPDEADVLDEEGLRNLRELVAFVRAEGIDAELEETGTLDVAAEPWQVDGLREYAELGARHGASYTFLERDEIQALVHSPRFAAAVRGGADRCVRLNPAKLAWGLAAAAERRGARVAEGTRVRRLERRAGRVDVHTEGGGIVEADQVLVGTSAYSMWLRRLETSFVPVYDYVLMTEPLTEAQRASIGWAGREGMSDAGNQFHYFRQSADGRILWGGYDAIYHPGNRVTPAHDRRPATWEALARQFGETFPQLDGIRFTHRWGGAIDTSTRFTVTFGDTLGGRVHYALGYTGLGVGSTRWAAGILRDKVVRPDSELLRLRFVRSTPFPIPPEPVRTPAVEVMRRAVIGADAAEGRRGVFLRAMDALGIGFDS